MWYNGRPAESPDILIVDKRIVMTTPENKQEKPKIRVVKGGQQRARGGVIVVEGKDGKTFYRCSCDRCNQFATLSFQPLAGKEVVCQDCRWIVNKAKPSTKVIRKQDRVTYATECDLCDTVERTPFLPKKDRQFLCNSCKRAADLRAKQEAPVRLKEKPAIRERPAEVEEKPIEGFAATVKEETTADTATYEEPCNQCGKPLSLRFKPEKPGSIVCSDCYRPPESPNKVPKKPIAETRIFYNIECIVCGKKETVDFVPKLGSDAVCTRCFEMKKRRY